MVRHMKPDLVLGTPMSLREGLLRFVQELGLDAVVDDIDAGLDVLEGEIAAVALDLHRAEKASTPMAEAVRDEVGRPNLYRLHMAFSDVLTTTLDEELQSWVKQVLHAPPLELFHDLEVGLARTAIDPDQPHFLRLLVLKQAMIEDDLDLADGEERLGARWAQVCSRGDPMRGRTLISVLASRFVAGCEAGDRTYPEPECCG